MMLTLSSLLGFRTVSTTILLLLLILLFPACAKRARRQIATIQPKANEQQSVTSSLAPNSDRNQTPQRINLNTASANELETLPGIGKGLAARIIEHREKWGAFRRAEHLIIVRGISDRRFRALRDLITVG